MPLFKLLLFVLFALNASAMFSGFMLARRMGMYLMIQVMTLMLAMLVALAALGVGLFAPPAAPSTFDALHIVVIVDLVVVLAAVLMEAVQIMPILLKTMQGGPIHSAHLNNLIMALFLALAMALYYPQLAAL